MSIEDRLAELTADLLELEVNSPFLERLFALQAGIWADTAVLCHDVPHIKSQVEIIQHQLPGKLHTTWLEYPQALHGKGYCLIVFFSEELLWSNTALYNKQWFCQKATSHRG